MDKFNNWSIERNIKLIIDSGVPIRKGTLSGFSIETVEEGGYQSYLYKDNEIDRDEDFEKLKSMIFDS